MCMFQIEELGTGREAERRHLLGFCWTQCGMSFAINKMSKRHRAAPDTQYDDDDQEHEGKETLDQQPLRSHVSVVVGARHGFCTAATFRLVSGAAAGAGTLTLEKRSGSISVLLVRLCGRPAEPPFLPSVFPSRPPRRRSLTDI